MKRFDITATPKAQSDVDKLLGRVKIDQGASSVPSPERVRDNNASEGEYKVYDIYEGIHSNENTQKNDDKKD